MKVICCMRLMMSAELVGVSSLAVGMIWTTSASEARDAAINGTIGGFAE